MQSTESAADGRVQLDGMFSCRFAMFCHEGCRAWRAGGSLGTLGFEDAGSWEEADEADDPKSKQRRERDPDFPPAGSTGRLLILPCTAALAAVGQHRGQFPAEHPGAKGQAGRRWG